jgi:hypothetical protein
MSHRMRIFVPLAIAMALLAPDAVAQKPPSPPPSSPPTSPSPTGASPIPASQPSESTANFVMFLRGRVATPDGSNLPNDALVKRVCDNKVRQEVYASPNGDFSMQLGARADSFPEASADASSPNGASNKDLNMGIPRTELTKCDLRVSASGFRPSVVNLIELDTFSSSVDVGLIVVRRATKVEGTTLSATPYLAPKDARTAYEKGIQARRNGKIADARKYFETAVAIYPAFVNAWYFLGTVLQKENQNDAARKAYTQATTLNTKYLPPYVSLASMAYQSENWTEVLKFTGHILDLDPLNHAADTSDILDLDPLNSADAYFYDAAANFMLNRIEAAEKSGLKAEHLDLRTHFPELHLLLAQIFAQKNNYAPAIAELQIYLALLPHAKDEAPVREMLAKLEKLKDSVPPPDKPDQR